MEQDSQMQSKTLNVKLPFPPSVNNYTATYHGRKILSKRGRDYKMDCQIEILKQRPFPKLKGAIGIKIKFVPPDNRRRDLDNLNKAVLDALKENNIIEDDNYFVLNFLQCVVAEKNKETCGAYVTIFENENF